MDPAAMTPSDRLEARQSAWEPRTPREIVDASIRTLQAWECAEPPWWFTDRERRTWYAFGGRVEVGSVPPHLESVTDHDAEPRTT